jgi:hypothetical protein
MGKHTKYMEELQAWQNFEDEILYEPEPEPEHYYEDVVEQEEFTNGNYYWGSGYDPYIGTSFEYEDDSEYTDMGGGYGYCYDD